MTAEPDAPDPLHETRNHPAVSINLLRASAFSFDMTAVITCWIIAYQLRFNFAIPDEFSNAWADQAALLLITHAPVFWFSGLYRGIWRYASMMDLRRIVVAAALASTMTTALFFMLGLPLVPRSVLVMHPLLLILLMGGGRFAYRLWKDRRLYGHLALTGEPVLVLGAAEAGERLVRELHHSTEWRVAGLLDDDRTKHGREVHGVKVRGGIDTIAHWAADLGVENAIVAMPEAPLAARRHAMEAAVQAGLRVLTVPALDDLIAGRVTLANIRRVELEDLLGRDQLQLDDAGLSAMLAGQVVLVTGAGGSIGSELVRQVARFRPARIVLYELSEFALYTVSEELAHTFPDVPVTPAIGDTKDSARLTSIFSKHHPSVVLHAAAYKHVPLMEDFNAWEAVRNNVEGTLCLARIAVQSGCGRVVLISTDKAVNPTNVMGASKRLAERVVQAIGLHAGQDGCPTRFVIVRFGNVLGSNGSVIPKFREQIARGGPVTVTHPEIIRYFMLIPEAAQLVLQAALMGKGGEIFVMDMGEPVRIIELARDMIRLSGFSEEEIPIEITGLRPGEKLYEELLADDETTLPTPHPKLRIARSTEAIEDGDKFLADIDAWLHAPANAPGQVRARLAHYVPEYRTVSGPPATPSRHDAARCATHSE